ncbi:MAG: linear amide C-N hydrolase [Bacillota bacterium]
MRVILLFSTILLMLMLFLLSGSAWACTSYTTKTTDGLVFYTRTMEFESTEVLNHMRVVPVGSKFQGSLPDGTFNGMKWVNKHGYTGVMFNPEMPMVIDGVNDAGLAAGALLFPGYGVYQEFLKSDAEETIAHWDVIDWILGNFATVAEVRKNIGFARVTLGNKIHSGNIDLPLHYVVHDKAGNSLVLEYSDGHLHVFDNPYGVFTNSPTFDWMLTYLKNFPTITPNNTKSIVSGSGFGEGTGMVGLPGDFTPPSRFVRIVALTQSALPTIGADAGLNLAMTIIDNVQIPVGTVRDVDTNVTAYDQTTWTAVADTSRLRYYYRTYNNRNWRYVDLKQALIGLKAPTSFPLNTPADYSDVTSKMLAGGK